MLLIQWDGYVVNPEAWDPAFLGCDYLGAKWYWHDDGMRVGNGGFSLRSRRLLDALAGSAHRARRSRGHDDLPHVPAAAGARARHRLRQRGARRPVLVRGRLSGRPAVRLSRPLQFLPRRPARRDSPRWRRRSPTPSRARRSSSRCCATASRSASGAPPPRSRGASLAVRARRRRRAARSLAFAERNAAASPVAGRNDPCPCGSGRKFKQCHGALGAAGSGSARTGAGGSATVAATGAAAAAPPPRPPRIRPMRWRAPASTPPPRRPRGRRRAATARRSPRRRTIRSPRTTSASSSYQRGRLDDALPLLERAAAAIPRRARVPQQPGPRARRRRPRRRGDRRVPAQRSR